MDSEKIVDQLILNSKDIKDAYSVQIKSSENLIHVTIKTINIGTGNVLDEKSFLSLIALLISRIYGKNDITKKIVYFVALKVLNVADKILDKLFGPNWFERIKNIKS